MDELYSFYLSAFDLDANIHAVFPDPDTGETVVYVLDDTPQALAPYATRAAGVRFERAPMFTAPPPADLEPLDIPTKRFRPAPAGVSCGSYRITAGTLGLIVRDNLTGKQAVLSNNHVLADVDAGRVGDDILQPGAADGGIRAGDTIARLTRFQPLRTTQTRVIDAAIADVLRDEDVSLEVNELGYVYPGTVDPYPHQQVTKSGRTTTLSRGEVAAIGAKVRVDYGTAGVISVDDCIILNLYSAPGDSGSPIIDFCSHRMVGLLFAGNGLQTIACMFSHIERLLDVEVIDPPEHRNYMGVDVSKWQGDIQQLKDDMTGHVKYNLDVSPQSFATMKDKGVDFVIMKVCQGADIIDSKFAVNYDRARAAGMLVGGYIYVDPAVSAAAHFQNFLQAVGDRDFSFTTSEGETRYFPVCLDIEQTSGQSNTTITSVLQGLITLIEDWQGGEPAMIYSNLSFANKRLLSWSGWKERYLWMAYWSSREVYYPAIPNHWRGAEDMLMVWQVGPFEVGQYMGVDSVALDLNKTFAWFGRKILGGVPAPDPDPDPDPDPEPDPDEKAVFEHHKARALVNLNWRSGPGTNYARLGTMPAGTVVDVLGEVQNGLDLWAQIGHQQYAAYTYRGAQYLAYVMQGDPLAHGIMRVYGKLAGWLNRLLSWLRIGEA